MTSHKNKTIAALLASVGGVIGLHRFYLAGAKDRWAWLHCASVPASALIFLLVKDVQPLFAALPMVVSALAGALTSLVIGTTSDEKWDAHVNPTSGRQSASGWQIALLLVLTLAVSAGSLIAVIARCFDLLFTGGLYG